MSRRENRTFKSRFSNPDFFECEKKKGVLKECPDFGECETTPVSRHSKMLMTSLAIKFQIRHVAVTTRTLPLYHMWWYGLANRLTCWPDFVAVILLNDVLKGCLVHWGWFIYYLTWVRERENERERERERERGRERAREREKILWFTVLPRMSIIECSLSQTTSLIEEGKKHAEPGLEFQP